MYKKQDNDIFGTNNYCFSPRIENNSYIDPNAIFKKNTQNNYQRYAAKVSTVPHIVTGKAIDTCKVNQSAFFQQNYHKNRKELDLQSNIFYPPTKPSITQSRVTSANTSLHNTEQINFGRKQTLTREIKRLPINSPNSKGNISKLFDLNERVKPKTQQNIPISPLIPIQMQWDQHDSIKYSHINDQALKNKDKKAQISTQQQFNNIEQNQSVYISHLKKIEQPKEKEEIKTIIKAKSEKQIKSVPTKSDKKEANKPKEPVQIIILKGWDYKFMEGLSKNCKLYNSAILKFQSHDEGKASLTIKRSERWESITDWLRREAKLKIRVVNN